MQLVHRFREGWDRALYRLLPAPSPRWPRLTPIARTLERGVHLLDSAVQIPGTRLRIGLDPVLGLVLPAVGDALGGFVSLGVLFLALQYRVPARVLKQMVWNVAVDAAVGGIPVVGDAFDFVWKANERNFDLLMRHRGDVPKRSSLMYWLACAGLIVLALAAVVTPIVVLVWIALHFRAELGF
jgi:hypothetical protein